MKAEADYQQFSIRAVAILAAGLLIAGNAIAASNVICDKAGRQLLASDAARLKVENVDHVPHVATLKPGESLDATDVATETPSPLIELSPQVESMFDRIFDGEADLADALESSSPFAETSNGDGAESAIRDSELEVDPEISSIHAEMFRNDI